jgi:formate dehydrogenase assembly factor FdhD
MASEICPSVDLARKFNVILIGFVLSNRMNAYTFPKSYSVEEG